MGGMATGSTVITGPGTVTVSQTVAGGTGGRIANGVSGNGGDGGIANAGQASATSTGSETASLTASTTGGQGGIARGEGFTGGAGGMATFAGGSIQSATGNINGTANLTGGGGGDGTELAGGGDGSMASLTDSLTGSANGNVTFTQNVTGGRGGKSTGGMAGAGGDANSSLTLSRSTGLATTMNASSTGGIGGDGTLGGVPGLGGAGTSFASAIGADRATAAATATGGNGGKITTGSLGTGMAGGNATAMAWARTLGAFNSNATAMATGGNGGNSSSGRGGTGGHALATATSTSLSNATATATATGGTGLTGAPFGNATARANGFGTAGTTNATARSGGGLLQSIVSVANSPTDGETQTESRAFIGDAIPDATAASGLEVAAFTTGSPGIAAAQAFTMGNPDISVHYGPTSDVLGLVTLGGSTSENNAGSSRTMTGSVTYAIDLNELPNTRQQLLVGLLDSRVEGSGFDSFEFQISREGTIVVDETFTTVADATSYFDSQLLDLGSNDSAAVVGDLDLEFSIALTSDDPDAGFYFDLMFGNSTEFSGVLTGDFDNNGVYDCADIDALVAAIVDGDHNLTFDITGDGLVNIADLDNWRLTAGSTNLGAGAAYLVGDANLDGSVDVSDFNLWNGNKFSSAPAWCSGDFNADGNVDVSDFNLWNAFKFTSSTRPAAVPEPEWSCWLLLAMFGFVLTIRKSNRARQIS